MSGDHDTPGVTSPVQLGTVPYDDSAEFWKAVYLAAMAPKHYDDCDPALVADDAVDEYRARFPVERSPHDFAELPGWREVRDRLDALTISGGTITTLNDAAADDDADIREALDKIIVDQTRKQIHKHLLGANVADTIKVGGGDVTTKTPGYPCEVHYYGDEPIHGDVYRFETPEQYEAWRKEKFGTP